MNSRLLIFAAEMQLVARENNITTIKILGFCSDKFYLAVIFNRESLKGQKNSEKFRKAIALILWYFKLYSLNTNLNFNTIYNNYFKIWY